MYILYMSMQCDYMYLNLFETSVFYSHNVEINTGLFIYQNPRQTEHKPAIMRIPYDVLLYLPQAYLLLQFL